MRAIDDLRREQALLVCDLVEALCSGSFDYSCEMAIKRRKSLQARAQALREQLSRVFP